MKWSCVAGCSPRFSVMATSVMAVMLLAACSRQTAEEKGREMANEKIDMAQGIGDVLQQKGGAATESVATGLGAMVKGVGRGVEKSMRALVVTPAVAAAKLDITKVQNITVPASGVPVHGLEAYVVTHSDAKGQLKVQVFDVLDREIGRARIDVVQSADEGRYLTIPLDSRISLSSIVKVVFDFQADVLPAGGA